MAPCCRVGNVDACICRLGELAEPYWILKDAGYDVTIASPAGGAVPIDQASLQGDFKTPECDRMMEDGGFNLQGTQS